MKKDGVTEPEFNELSMLDQLIVHGLNVDAESSANYFTHFETLSADTQSLLEHFSVASTEELVNEISNRLKVISEHDLSHLAMDEKGSFIMNASLILSILNNQISPILEDRELLLEVTSQLICFHDKWLKYLNEGLTSPIKPPSVDYDDLESGLPIYLASILKWYQLKKNYQQCQTTLEFVKSIIISLESLQEYGLLGPICSDYVATLNDLIKKVEAQSQSLKSAHAQGLESEDVGSSTSGEHHMDETSTLSGSDSALQRQAREELEHSILELESIKEALSLVEEKISMSIDKDGQLKAQEMILACHTQLSKKEIKSLSLKKRREENKKNKKHRRSKLKHEKEKVEFSKTVTGQIIEIIDLGQEIEAILGGTLDSSMPAQLDLLKEMRGHVDSAFNRLKQAFNSTVRLISSERFTELSLSQRTVEEHDKMMEVMPNIHVLFARFEKHVDIIEEEEADMSEKKLTQLHVSCDHNQLTSEALMPSVQVWANRIKRLELELAESHAQAEETFRLNRALTENNIKMAEQLETAKKTKAGAENIAGELINDKMALKAEIQKQRAELEEQKAEIQRQVAEIERQSIEIEQQRAENKELSKCSKRMSDKLGSLSKTIETVLKVTGSDAAVQTDPIVDGEKRTLKATVLKQKKKAEKDGRRIKARNERIKELEQQLAGRDKLFEEQTSSMKDKVVSLKEACSETRAQIRELMQEIEKVKADARKQKELLEQEHKHAQKVSEETNKELASQNTSLSKENATLRAQMLERTEYQSELLNQIDTDKATIDALQKQLQKVKREREEVNVQGNALMVKYVEANAAINAAQMKIVAQSTSLREKQNRIDALIRQLQAKEQESQKHLQSKAELEGMLAHYYETLIRNDNFHHQELNCVVQDKRARIELPVEAVTIMAEIQKFGAQCYVYGGFIRDSLLGLSPKDVDIITNLTPEHMQILRRDFFPRFGGRLIESEHVPGLYTLYREGMMPIDIRLVSTSDLSFLRHASKMDINANTFLATKEGKVLDPAKQFVNVMNGDIHFHCSEEELIKDPVRLLRGLKLWSKLGLEPNAHDRLWIENHIECLDSLALPVFLKHFLAAIKADPSHFVDLVQGMDPCVQSVLFRECLNGLEASQVINFYDEMIDIGTRLTERSTFYPEYLKLLYKAVHGEQSASADDMDAFIRERLSPWLDDPSFERVLNANLRSIFAWDGRKSDHSGAASSTFEASGVAQVAELFPSLTIAYETARAKAPVAEDRASRAPSPSSRQ